MPGRAGHLPRAALAGLLLAGCADAPFGPSERVDAAKARARWEARGFGDYTFEFRVSCYCAPELNDWSAIVVRDGAVVEARSVASGDRHPAYLDQAWSTIEALFDDLLRRRNRGDLVDIVARFDKQLGFPSYINYSYDPGIMDAGAVIYVRNVSPLD